jgi:hypothetical protein
MAKVTEELIGTFGVTPYGELRCVAVILHTDDDLQPISTSIKIFGLDPAIHQDVLEPRPEDIKQGENK